MSADALGTLAYVLQRARPFARFVSGRHRATGFRFTFDKHDFVGRRILRYQTWERELTAWIDSYLDTAATPGLFLDIGANIGWFSLMATRHARITKVVAFEPDSVNGFLLDTNVRSNGLDAAITTVGCALGDARGVARLHRYKHSNLGQHSLLKDFGHGSAVAMVETLDHVLDQLGLADQPIACMKIDVEGYEPCVLAGAAGALRRTQCVVVELSRTFSVPAGLDFAGMVDSLQALGFVPVFSDHENPVPGFATLRAQDRQTTVAFVRPAPSLAPHAPVRN
jgi:FkbM family methyltransferase